MFNLGVIDELSLRGPQVRSSVNSVLVFRLVSAPENSYDDEGGACQNNL